MYSIALRGRVLVNKSYMLFLVLQQRTRFVTRCRVYPRVVCIDHVFPRETSDYTQNNHLSMLHAAQSIPSLIVTNPTPIKSSCAPSIAATAENSTRTPSRCSTARLLYRGALSLPDSHLPLDGLTFTIDLHPSSSAFRVGSNEHGHVGHDALFETPLPLALESMRGRPNLPALGTVKMNEIVCDMSERVNL